MRIFDFRCTVCGIEQEKFVNGDAPMHCGEEMDKLLSFRGAFVFKGTGFYATEWGRQEYNLEPTHQAQRAARELKDLGMVCATPTGTSSAAVEQYQRRREAGI